MMNQPPSLYQTMEISFKQNEILKSIKALKNRFLNATFMVKLLHWEFWDFNVVYAAVGVLHIWQSIKAKSFFYFSASNPGLENSGFIGEKKSGIMELIPDNVQPKWFLVDKLEFNSVIENIEIIGISFPLIAKPNIGERGKGVSKIANALELRQYFKNINVPFIIQEFVDEPLELGVFYYRMPGSENGIVSSIVAKEFLQITGNGISTLAEMVEANPRARFVKDFLSQKHADVWNEVLKRGETLKLEEIGNHCRGTTFLDGNQFITPKFEAVIDGLSHKIPGFYFGRYDLRAKSFEALENGDFQILELNGAGAEPAHIYQPGFSFWEGQKVLLHHWKVLFQISMINKKQGIKFWTLKEAKKVQFAHKNSLNAIFWKI